MWFNSHYIIANDRSVLTDHAVIILSFCQFVDRFYQLMDVSCGRLTLPEMLDAFGKIAW